ncbi:KdsC family phosphatase [Paenibacillus tarimensis]
MLKDIKLICCDVDGTLTDGTIHVSSEGEMYKSFHVRDGLGIVMAQKAGIIFAIVTGRGSRIVDARAKELGIEEVHQNVTDKSERVRSIITKYNLKKEQVAFIGDDVNDAVVKDEVGVFVVVGDGHPEAKKVADIVLQTNGGKGAVREFIDRYILSAR